MISQVNGTSQQGSASFQSPVTSSAAGSVGRPAGSGPRVVMIKYEKRPDSDGSEPFKCKPFSHTGNGYSHNTLDSGRQSSLSDVQNASHPMRYSSAYSQYSDVFEDTPMFSPFSPNENKGRLSPIQQFMSYRSPSPDHSVVSSGSKKTKDSMVTSDTEGAGSVYEPQFGRFYNSSFLTLQSNPKDFRRSPVDRHKENKAPLPSWHRPENFSYRQVRRDNKPTRSSVVVVGKSMLTALGDKKVTEKSSKEVMDKREAIKLSRFPSAHKPENEHSSPIERDDWPAPPEPAAVYPELLREHPLGSGRAKSIDEIVAEEEMEEEAAVDVKTQKKIEELEKINSGLGDTFMVELKQMRRSTPSLDPRSASRTPAADHEPSFKTRYESPIFASPSRLEGRPILYSLDDQILGRKYRNSTLPLSNYPLPKPGYGLRRSRNYHDGYVSEPDYTRGYMSEPDYRTGRVDSSHEKLMDETIPLKERTVDQRRAGESRETVPSVSSVSGRERHERSRSPYASQSSVEEYDPETGLRRRRLLRSTAGLVDGSTTSSFGKIGRAGSGILRADDPPRIFPYEELLITNKSLPPGVDRNFTEFHLSKDEFESIFRMSREEFFRLAEWKRNDLKKKVNLF